MINKKTPIIGCCGSGKSTLAKKIHSKTGLPLIHLDKLYYKPNWEKAEKQEWEKEVGNLCNTDEWIIDGNYICTLELRAEKADMANGCVERFYWKLYRFIWNFRQTIYPLIYNILDVYKFTNPKIVP